MVERFYILDMTFLGNQANSLIKIKQEKGERTPHAIIFSVTSARMRLRLADIQGDLPYIQKVRFSGFQNP